MRKHKYNYMFDTYNITQQFLQECFEYNEQDGHLYWKERPQEHFAFKNAYTRFMNNSVGKQASYRHTSNKYFIVPMQLKISENITKTVKFSEHRLIWLLLTGENPEIIDHIDKNPLNNKIENLRNVSQFENRHNTLGISGVTYKKENNAYIAQILDKQGKKLYLGSFDTEIEALKVYRQKALEIYGVNLGQEHLFDDCLNWFKICKPYPSKEDLQTQTGAVLEEIGEFLISLGLDASVINTYAKEFYTKQKEIPEDTKVDQLDAIGDILVTLTGFSYMQKFNLKGTFEEINLSNASKLEDGKPVFNEQGKIAKGKDYFKPNLEQYV